jgi:hypothetical protein
MELRTPCPSCGKRARYSEAEAGLPGVCHACGMRFTFPSAAAALPSDDIPLAVPLPGSGLTNTAWVWAALAGGIVIGLFVGFLAAIMLNRSLNPTPAAASANSSSSIAGPRMPTQIPFVPTAAPVAEDRSEPASAQQPTTTLSTPESSETPAASASITPQAHESFVPDGGPISSTPQTSNPKPPAKTPAADTSGRPPIHPIAENADTLTDARIGQAITDGVNFVLSHFDNNTRAIKLDGANFQPLGPTRPDSGAFYGGLDALEVYALLQSGQAITDNRLGIKSPYMISLIEQLKKMPDKLGPVTYARALRATALTLFNRPEDKTVIKGDLEWLLKASQNGAYTYDKIDTSIGGPSRFMPRGLWDASNSQYGLLGVWSAAEAGYEVPLGYWKQVEDHWTKNQMATGEWGYETPDAGAGRLSMTVAGIASLFVTHDYLIAPRFGNEVGRDPFSPALSKGLDWLEGSNHCIDTSSSRWLGYTLYGIERVGLASGFKYFGSHDWYRELARQVIAAQNPDGSWGEQDQELIDTPYVLLFLARGRHPIVMNKLRFDGFWANRPRDLANFSRYASDEMETPVNWQVIPIDHDWTDWTDCPVLYMASHKAPTLTDANYDNIRSFIQSGGLLFTQADGGDPEFDRFVGEMAKKLFPNYPLTALSPDHPLFSSLFHMQIKPSLKAVSNGARLLMVHSSVDLARAWQLREQKVNKMPFEFGLNLFLYASGKHQLRNRLETNYITAPSEAPTYTINVARVRYGSDRDHAGNWDPEPYAWTRFSRWFQRQTGYGVDAKEIDMSDLTLPAAPIAILTGTDAYEPEKAEIQAVRKYVEAGGVLFVDSAGGTGAFEESVRTKLFARAFPNGFLRLLPSDHPLLNSGNPGMEDLSHPRLRPFALEKLGSPANEYPSSFTAGRGHVIFTPLDMTCGLLGTNTWGILGYEPGYSQSFIKNLLLWTVDGQKDD